MDLEIWHVRRSPGIRRPECFLIVSKASAEFDKSAWSIGVKDNYSDFNEFRAVFPEPPKSEDQQSHLSSMVNRDVVVTGVEIEFAVPACQARINVRLA